MEIANTTTTLQPTFTQKVAMYNVYLNKRFSFPHHKDKLTDRELKWFYDHALTHNGLYRKNKAWAAGKCICMSCYDEFVVTPQNTIYETVDGKTVAKLVCPHCGQTLNIIPTRKITDHTYDVFGKRSMMGNLEVVQVFESERYLNYNNRCKFNNGHKSWEMDRGTYEVMRVWKDPQSGERMATYGTRKGFYAYSFSPWACGELLVRKTSLNGLYEEGYGGFIDPPVILDSDKELEAPDLKYKLPVYVALANISKSKTNYNELIDSVIKIPLLESMVKAGYEREASYVANHTFTRYVYYEGHHYSVNKNEMLNILRICMKNHYHIKDMSLYLDYLIMLKQLLLDTHNAHYICPANLTEAHDKLMHDIERNTERLQAEREARRAKLDIEEAKKHEAEYAMTHGHYFGIRFSHPTLDLHFHVISTVAEMKEEGRTMHHCVGMYWSHEDSLIIGCRNADGHRLATIEVDLKDFTIAQTRAVCNGVPEHLNEINDAIMAHIDEIKAAHDEELAGELSTGEELETIGSTPCYHMAM